MSNNGIFGLGPKQLLTGVHCIPYTIFDPLDPLPEVQHAYLFALNPIDSNHNIERR